MEENKINEKELLENGWIKLQDPFFLMEKKLPNNNPINDDDNDTGMKLALHYLFNEPIFALVFPGGDMVNLNIGTIEELDIFEKSLLFYDPNF